VSHWFLGRSLGQLDVANMASHAVGIVPLPVMFFGAAFLEEVGWKGYGMDSLRGKRTFFTATLLYSFLWVFWHIPLFFINNYYHNTLLKTDPILAVNFIASVIPAAFIINWLWYRNGRSIIAAVLFHVTANLQGILQMGQTAKCIETVILSIFALAIVLLDKDVFFKDFSPVNFKH
nr:CPBP family intramembrane metalloprotease [Candidatus Omnitrophota bacterium]